MIIPWPFSPLVLRPALWLDASDASTLYSGGSLAAADGAISEWRDKSGNARHATQATGVSQPLRKTAIQNGRDVVRFDGSNDGLFRTTADAGMKPTSRSIFMVSKDSATGAERCQFDVGNTFALTQNGTSGKWYAVTAKAFTAPSGAFWLFSVVETVGSTSIARTNSGADIALASPTFIAATGAYAVGSVASGGLYFNGDISEILVFPTALSGADRQAVESYLNAKWAIY